MKMVKLDLSWKEEKELVNALLNIKTDFKSPPPNLMLLFKAPLELLALRLVKVSLLNKYFFRVPLNT